MIQGVRPSSPTKKLAMVNMPNTLLAFGKAKTLNRILCWEWTTTMIFKGLRGTIRSL
jgi:hypothetical protein